MHLRVLSLINLVGMPCELSLRDISKVTGLSRYKTRSVIDDMNGLKFSFVANSGRGKSTFDLLKQKPSQKDNTKTKSVTIRKQYDTCVWLTDNEYESILKEAGSEKNRDLAIHIYASWKTSKNLTEKKEGDYYQIVKWAIGVVIKNKEEKRIAKQQAEDARFIREEQNIKNEERINTNYKQAISREEYIRRKEEFLKTHTEEEWMIEMERKRKQYS